MAKRINIDTKYVKTYSTLARLEKAIEDVPYKYAALQTPEGRYYALFIGEDAIYMTNHGHAVTN